MHHIHLNSKKPVKLPIINKGYILRNIARSGAGEGIVFMSIEEQKPLRLFRIEGDGCCNYLLKINRAVTFTFRGKGSCSLSFSTHDVVEEDISEQNISYMCEVITPEQMKKFM
ncbi:Nucleoplasmin-like domain-containing protein [Entamoeba marina]